MLRLVMTGINETACLNGEPEAGEGKQGGSATWPENQGMKPSLLRYAAMAMRAANQVRVSQAWLLLRHSFQVVTPVTSRMVRPTSAAATAFTPMLAPQIL